MPDPTLLGGVYPFTFTVKNEAGVLTAPATATLTVTKPDSTADTKHLVDFTNPSTGVYDLDYLPASAGRYAWYWVTTAPNTAAQGWFDVVAPGTDQWYLDATDLRDALAGTENAAGTAAALSDDDLCSKIEEAQAEVDSRLAAHYTTPFVDPPLLVVSVTRDIAAYLATLLARKGDPIQPGDPVQLQYNRAQTLLGRMETGAFPLQIPGGTGSEAATPESVVINPTSGDLWSEADFNLHRRIPGVGSLTSPWFPGC